MTTNWLSLIGLLLNVAGSIVFTIDTNRLSALLANIVKQMSADFGKWDAHVFSKDEKGDLEHKIRQSARYTRIGYGLFLLGFLLQLIDTLKISEADS